jgi:hypothetical protein
MRAIMVKAIIVKVTVIMVMVKVMMMKAMTVVKICIQNGGPQICSFYVENSDRCWNGKIFTLNFQL